MPVSKFSRYIHIKDAHVRLRPPTSSRKLEMIPLTSSPVEVKAFREHNSLQVLVFLLLSKSLLLQESNQGISLLHHFQHLIQDLLLLSQFLLRFQVVWKKPVQIWKQRDVMQIWTLGAHLYSPSANLHLSVHLPRPSVPWVPAAVGSVCPPAPTLWHLGTESKKGDWLS